MVHEPQNCTHHFERATTATSASECSNPSDRDGDIYAHVIQAGHPVASSEEEGGSNTLTPRKVLCLHLKEEGPEPTA